MNIIIATDRNKKFVAFIYTKHNFCDINWENISENFFYNDYVNLEESYDLQMSWKNIKLTGNKYELKKSKTFFWSDEEKFQKYEEEFSADCFWETEPVGERYVTIRNDLVIGKVYGMKTPYDYYLWTEEKQNKYAGKRILVSTDNYGDYILKCKVYYPMLNIYNSMYVTEEMLYHDNYGRLSDFVKSNKGRYVVRFIRDKDSKLENICKELGISRNSVTCKKDNQYWNNCYYCPQANSLMDMFDVKDGDYKVFDYYNFTW